MTRQPTSKFVMIVLTVILMIALVVTVGNSLTQEAAHTITTGASHNDRTQAPAAIRAEQGVFRGSDQASRFSGSRGPSIKSMETYYARRAYPGAPPFIPHPVANTMASEFEDCLGCHEKGGYAQIFAAYAPVTPHPEFTNCRQCHVTQNSPMLFTATNWEKPTPPMLGQSALAGSPPPIPHQLQLRENCSACHSGPASPPAIRTSHPERVYCRQCHVPAVVQSGFTR